MGLQHTRETAIERKDEVDLLYVSFKSNVLQIYHMCRLTAVNTAI